MKNRSNCANREIIGIWPYPDFGYSIRSDSDLPVTLQAKLLRLFISLCDAM